MGLEAQVGRVASSCCHVPSSSIREQQCARMVVVVVVPRQRRRPPLLQAQREAGEQLHDVGVTQVGVKPRLVLVLPQLQRHLARVRVSRGLCCCCSCCAVVRLLGRAQRGRHCCHRAVQQGLPDLNDLHCHH